MHTITFLGTSAGVPTRFRNVSALALQPENSKKWMLFDCGEATQHQIMKTSFSAYNLERIFITHLHGDHVYGLCGLLASKGMQRSESPLEIYGPKGLQEMLECVMQHSQLNLPFDLKIFEIDGKSSMRFGAMKIEVVELSHSITSYGFVISFDNMPGRFDARKAKEMNIPEGPLYARLKAGENITLPDGRMIKGSELVGPPRKGARIVIGGDNDNPLLFSPYAPFDLMIHEATYTQRDFERLERKFRHTTAKQLAEAAQEMGVDWLILNHISPRYDKNGRVVELLEEAKRYFGGRVDIAYDFMKIEI